MTQDPHTCVNPLLKQQSIRLQDGSHLTFSSYYSDINVYLSNLFISLNDFVFIPDTFSISFPLWRRKFRSSEATGSQKEMQTFSLKLTHSSIFCNIRKMHFEPFLNWLNNKINLFHNVHRIGFLSSSVCLALMIVVFSVLAPLYSLSKGKKIFKEHPFHMRVFFFFWITDTLGLLENISNSFFFFTHKWFVSSKPVNLWRNHKKVIKKMNFAIGLKTFLVKCKIDMLKWTCSELCVNT